MLQVSPVGALLRGRSLQPVPRENRCADGDTSAVCVCVSVRASCPCVSGPEPVSLVNQGCPQSDGVDGSGCLR